ncbi:MAG: hypothetical protein L3J07_04075 [Candidatus Magasanikbacteria bacterium]|nr:hypothetical protein [Candidatus Magasanikbacteria bacterium]
MRKFFSAIFVFSILTLFCFPIFGQGYVSLETEVSVQNNVASINTLGYAEVDNIFIFASVSENFSQVYGGLTISANELSAGAGIGVTGENNFRTALFTSWREKYYSFSAVGEMDLSEDSKGNFFYILKFLTYSPENILRYGWVLRRFNGFGPLLEFNFGSHITVWSSPVMYGILETGKVSSMFGLRIKN